MKKQIIALLLIGLSITAYSQKVEYLPASRFAPVPAAGADYLKDHVKQELNYPEALLASDKSGEVFIRFLVNTDGVVETAKITATDNEKFNDEALRYFHTIVWKKDPLRRVNPETLDGMRIKFDPKFYAKTVKKRGYRYTNELISIPASREYTIYNKNQLDSLPQLISGDNMNKFAIENLKYPQEAISRKVGGVVKYRFIIEPYGMASNFELVNAVAGGCNEETMRLLKLMRWTPGIKDEKAVRTIMEFSLVFNASGGGGYEMYDGNSNSSN